MNDILLSHQTLNISRITMQICSEHWQTLCHFIAPPCSYLLLFLLFNLQAENSCVLCLGLMRIRTYKLRDTAQSLRLMQCSIALKLSICMKLSISMDTTFIQDYTQSRRKKVIETRMNLSILQLSNLKNTIYQAFPSFERE